MKNAVIRTALASLVAGSALVIGLAAPAAADEPCALLVVCAPTDPAGPAVPPDAQPPVEQPAPAPQQPPAAPAARTSAAVTADLLSMLNRERAAHGLPLFSRHGDLDGVAAGWSDHLAAAGALSHNDAYFTEASRREHGGRALGENVALDAEAKPAHDALMASPHHRDNILDARFTAVGLGATFRNGSWWITEDFLQPAASGQEVARSVPAPRVPSAPSAKARPAAPTRVAAPQPHPTNVATASPEQPAPTAEVEAATEVAPARHWLSTPANVASAHTEPVSSPVPQHRLPAPAIGVILALLCAIAGMLLRRRALSFAIS